MSLVQSRTGPLSIPTRWVMMVESIQSQPEKKTEKCSYFWLDYIVECSTSLFSVKTRLSYAVKGWNLVDGQITWFGCRLGFDRCPGRCPTDDLADDRCQNSKCCMSHDPHAREMLLSFPTACDAVCDAACVARATCCHSVPLLCCTSATGGVM